MIWRCNMKIVILTINDFETKSRYSIEEIEIEEYRWSDTQKFQYAKKDSIRYDDLQYNQVLLEIKL